MILIFVLIAGCLSEVKEYYSEQKYYDKSETEIIWNYISKNFNNAIFAQYTYGENDYYIEKSYYIRRLFSDIPYKETLYVEDDISVNSYSTNDSVEREKFKNLTSDSKLDIDKGIIFIFNKTEMIILVEQYHIFDKINFYILKSRNIDIIEAKKIMKKFQDENIEPLFKDFGCRSEIKEYAFVKKYLNNNEAKNMIKYISDKFNPTISRQTSYDSDGKYLVNSRTNPEEKIKKLFIIIDVDGKKQYRREKTTPCLWMDETLYRYFEIEHSESMTFSYKGDIMNVVITKKSYVKDTTIIEFKTEYNKKIFEREIFYQLFEKTIDNLTSEAKNYSPKSEL